MRTAIVSYLHEAKDCENKAPFMSKQPKNVICGWGWGLE